MGEDGCEVTAVQRVTVAAEVTVKPSVRCGTARVRCVGSRVVPDAQDVSGSDEERSGSGSGSSSGTSSGSSSASASCSGSGSEEDGECRFILVQELLVEIPVRFDASARCAPGRVFCTEPDVSGSGSESQEDCASSSDSSTGEGECYHAG